MIQSYLNERYPALVTTDAYIKGLSKLGFKIAVEAYGFFTYMSKGDAFIIGDIYIDGPYRKTKKCWELFAIIKAMAQGHSVLIGFSEKAGANHESGVKSMVAAGFKPVQELETMTVYMRGVY